MKKWKVILPVAACVMIFSQADAQPDNSVKADIDLREAEYAERLREAEVRMEQAARQIAEITSQRLPHLAQIERHIELSNKPRLGIAIGGSDKMSPVDGVEVDGVTPGSAAEDAGLRAGDVITAVNDESLKAASSGEANTRLLDFMQGVEEDDRLKVDYLRNGNAGSVEVTPRVVQMHTYAWNSDGQHPGASRMVKKLHFESGFPWFGSSLGSMELVELNAGLGKYFGTDSGLLVVSAPEAGDLELQDGDVIQSIDGRTPADVRHAMRILGSYKSGEELQLGIMRDKKKRTLNIEIPADHRGGLFAPAPVKPARAPVRPPALAPDVST